MNEDGNTRGTRRYVALDIHKHYCVVAGVDREGRVLLQPVRVEHADLEGWLKKHLQASNYVVIESTTNAWHVYINCWRHGWNACWWPTRSKSSRSPVRG